MQIEIKGEIMKTYLLLALLLIFVKTISAGTILVQHSMGVTQVPEEPQRVVILTNEGTEALLALGVKPVGAVKSWLGNPWYEHITDQMQGVAVVGIESSVNLEAIITLQPDLIIGNRMRQEKIYPQLSAIAPTVLSENLRGFWRKNFQLYAKALNQESAGAQLLSKFDNHIAQLKSKLGSSKSEQISVVRFLPGTARIYYKNSFSGVILEQIGFQRPAPQNRPDFAEKVTMERIPDMEGDRLFYFVYEKGDGKALSVEQEWTQSSLWQNLNVVKNKKVYRVSDATWNTSGGILSAQTVLHELADIYDIALN